MNAERLSPDGAGRLCREDVAARFRRGPAAGLAACMALATLVSGCAGYRLGSTLPAGIRSVAVPVFINRTEEPGLEARCTSAAIDQFQFDGTLKVLPAKEADTVVVVTLNSYRLESLRYDRDRAKSTTEYRAWLSADIEFRRTGGEVLLRRQIQADAAFDVEEGLDLALSKERALPEVARDLARRIVESVVEYW